MPLLCNVSQTSASSGSSKGLKGPLTVATRFPDALRMVTALIVPPVGVVPEYWNLRPITRNLNPFQIPPVALVISNVSA